MKIRVLILMVICLLLLSSILSGGNSIFWDTIFRGVGYELMYLRMNDNKLLKFTTYNKLKINRTDFLTFLREKGYTVSEIKVCIHNHPYSPKFSGGDKEFYRQICEAGFKGKFQVYFRGKIYSL